MDKDSVSNARLAGYRRGLARSLRAAWALQPVRAGLLIGLSALILYLLLRQIDAAVVWGLLKASPKGHLVWVGLLALVFPITAALRWQLILRSTGYRVAFRRSLVIVVGLFPASALSPARAGDLLRVHSLRGELRPAVVAGSVLAERALNILVLGVLAFGGGLWFGEQLIVGVSAAVIAMVAGSLLLVRLEYRLPVGDRLKGVIRDLMTSMRLLGESRVRLGLVLLLTGVHWSIAIVQTRILFDAVGASVGIGFVAAALPIALFAGLVPVTVGGMGTRDSAFVVLFAPVTESAQALTVSLLYSFFAVWLLAILGIPFIRRALNPWERGATWKDD